METNQYACKNCGHNEFIPLPNWYDVFMAKEDNSSLSESPPKNGKTTLFCRKCCEPLAFSEEDINT